MSTAVKAFKKGVGGIIGVAVGFVVLVAACGALLSAGDTGTNAVTNAAPAPVAAGGQPKAPGQGEFLCNYYKDYAFSVDKNVKAGELAGFSSLVTERHPANLQASAKQLNDSLMSGNAPKYADQFQAELNAYCGPQK